MPALDKDNNIASFTYIFMYIFTKYTKLDQNRLKWVDGKWNKLITLQFSSQNSLFPCFGAKILSTSWLKIYTLELVK